MSRMHSAAEHSASAEVSALDKLRVDLDGPEKKYNTDLKAGPTEGDARRRSGAPAPRLRHFICSWSADARSAGACGAARARRAAVSACLPRWLTRARRRWRALSRAQAPIFTQVNVRPRAPEHQVGWRRVLAGDPVEVAANDGAGFKVMTINEYTAAWKVRPHRPRPRSASRARNTEALGCMPRALVFTLTLGVLRAAQRRLPGLPGVRLPAHARAPLPPGVVPRHQELDRRVAVPRLPLLLLARLHVRSGSRPGCLLRCADAPRFFLNARSDPGYMAPEDYEKFMWCKLVPQNDAFQRARRSVIPA